MKRRSLSLKLFLLLGFTVSAFDSGTAQEELGGGILYGANWGCAVSAPSGWIMDQETWAKNNIYALFYEKGKKFGPTIPIVYVRTLQLNAATDAEIRSPVVDRYPVNALILMVNVNGTGVSW